MFIILILYLRNIHIPLFERWSSSWSYGSWMCNYLCKQCLSPRKLWVWIQLTTRCTRYNIMWYYL